MKQYPEVIPTESAQKIKLSEYQKYSINICVSINNTPMHISIFGILTINNKTITS